MNFQHLNQPQHDAQVYGFSGRRMQRMHRLQQSVEEEQPSECRHSDAHLIAVSREAKQNPIQALHLIAEGIPHQRAIGRLQGSVRQLSLFTRRVMENAYPGWELLDAEDQNMAAFQHSMINGDTNGYRAGFNAALSALEKFVEPITFDDIANSVNSLVEEA
ncbi:hypothetical protein MMK78_001092 [Raoultella planticola]|uniref:hypothetical protein n=1 Tax=Klebsiella/Raoultella group TaxID=2890311 RepID=UPI0007DADAC5|nr:MULTISPECIES: hypothetical protein [Klebsiella/Raoultella group]EIY2674314.1 hypothetical protein [Raoultella planticola]DAJ90922.1 MAG TPA: hypothetical protein [Caudoviricetes sp.]EJG2379772.1 hypothetical protein [Raoultella ornithinolytica]EKV6726565.1 hypothetical protein [Raoultella ornithinolytica]ELT0603065.1 hypothetical protein [Raoultella ornithinolytica]